MYIFFWGSVYKGFDMNLLSFLLPILLRKTRQRRGVSYDVMDELRRLSLSICFPALCHKLIYEIQIFHSINQETCTSMIFQKCNISKFEEKKEGIALGPLTKANIPTGNSKTTNATTQNAIKIDYTTIGNQS